MSFERSLQYFKEHQTELAETDYGKFVVIFDGTVVEFFDEIETAYLTARKKFPNERFLLTQCIRPEDEVMPVFHSRVS